MDYYRIFGLQPDCTDEEVKNAYRKLCLIKHPDRDPNNDHEEMVFINNAYNSINTQEKRNAYNNKFIRKSEESYINHKDYEKEVSITIKESIIGCILHISIEKETTYECDRCRGSGCEPGGFVSVCDKCNGDKSVLDFGRNETNHINFGFHDCEKCLGRGMLISSICTSCNGNGRKNHTIPLQVRIPAGIENGSTANLSVKDGPMRIIDVKIKISILNDIYWKRIENDLHITIEASFIEAYIGIETEVEDPLGKMISIKFPPCSKDGDQLTVKNEGVNGGDIIVTLKLNQMTSINKNMINIAKELLDSYDSYRHARKLPIGPKPKQIRKD